MLFRSSAPFALRDISVSIDAEHSETANGAAMERSGPEPVPVALARLSPGPHTLWVRAAAHDRAGERVLLLSTSQPLRIDKVPAAITVHVFTPGMGAERRIELSFDVQGGAVHAPVGGIAPAQPEAARCMHQPPVSAALCRTRQLAHKAIADRDAVLTECVRDKLLELRVLAAASPQGHPSPAAAGSDTASALAEQRARQLEEEVSRCPTTQMRAGLLVSGW